MDGLLPLFEQIFRNDYTNQEESSSRKNVIIRIWKIHKADENPRYQNEFADKI